MTGAECQRIAFADLADYAAGELTKPEAAALEEHLFACADCSAHAAEFDLLVHAILPAVRSAEVTGFATDAILNRLAREGVRVRTYALSPVAVVACAVWDDDEVMALRLPATSVAATSSRCHSELPARKSSARRGRLPPARTARSSTRCQRPGSVGFRSPKWKCS